MPYKQAEDIAVMVMVTMVFLYFAASIGLNFP